MPHPPSTDAIARWLLDVRTRARPWPQVFGELGDRVVEAGVTVERIRTSAITKHPEIFVRSVEWRRGRGVEVAEPSRNVVSTSVFLDSPVLKVRTTGDPLRCTLQGPDADLTYPVCRELAAEGFTDYAVYPLAFSTGERSYVSYATTAVDGFSSADLESLSSLNGAMAIWLELASAHTVVESLLRVYLGANAAARVIDGGFLRGSGQTIQAALWFCDMRGFTELADRLPAREVVRILDLFFEAVAGPIPHYGGEVLKFIGDAVLAVFPVGEEGPSDACRRALAAARAAVAGIDARMRTPDMPQLGLGVALHLGEVMYGNIGARDRLDFTVIGAAVNEVCRVEALCRSLGPILLTRDFAIHCGDEVEARGVHALKGVSTPREIFAPRAGSLNPA